MNPVTLIVISFLAWISGDFQESLPPFANGGQEGLNAQIVMAEGSQSPLTPLLQRRGLVGSFLESTSALAAEPVQANPQPPNLAPGYAPLPFPAPKPGSYQLPAMGSAADGKVLDVDGKTKKLHDLYGDKLVLLSFIYATCDDANGCPLVPARFSAWL